MKGSFPFGRKTYESFLNVREAPEQRDELFSQSIEKQTDALQAAVKHTQHNLTGLKASARRRFGIGTDHHNLACKAEERLCLLGEEYTRLQHVPVIASALPSVVSRLGESAKASNFSLVSANVQELDTLMNSSGMVVDIAGPASSFEYVLSKSSLWALERTMLLGSHYGVEAFNVAESIGATSPSAAFTTGAAASPAVSGSTACAAAISSAATSANAGAAASSAAFSAPPPPHPSTLTSYHLDRVCTSVKDAAEFGCPRAAALLTHLESLFPGESVQCQLWQAICHKDEWCKAARMVMRALDERQLKDWKKEAEFNPIPTLLIRPQRSFASPTHQAYLEGSAAAVAATHQIAAFFMYFTDGTTTRRLREGLFDTFVLPSVTEMRQRLYALFDITSLLDHHSLVAATQQNVEASVRNHLTTNKLTYEIRCVASQLNDGMDQVLAAVRMGAQQAGGARAALSADPVEAAMLAPAQQAQQGNGAAASEARAAPVEESFGSTVVTAQSGSLSTAEATALWELFDQVDQPALARAGDSPVNTAAPEAASVLPMAQDSAADEAAPDQATTESCGFGGCSSVSGEAGEAATAVAPPGFKTFTNRLYGCGGTNTPAAPNGHKRMEQVALDKEQQAAN